MHILELGCGNGALWTENLDKLPEHISVLLIKLDLLWKDEYLANLKKTKACYEAGYYYWKEASLWAEKANIGKFRFLFIQELQNWEDERERIGTGELNYKTMLDRELKRVNGIIAEIEAIDAAAEAQ